MLYYIAAPDEGFLVFRNADELVAKFQSEFDATQYCEWINNLRQDDLSSIQD